MRARLRSALQHVRAVLAGGGDGTGSLAGRGYTSAALAALFHQGVPDASAASALPRTRNGTARAPVADSNPSTTAGAGMHAAPPEPPPLLLGDELLSVVGPPGGSGEEGAGEDDDGEGSVTSDLPSGGGGLLADADDTTTSASACGGAALTAGGAADSSGDTAEDEGAPTAAATRAGAVSDGTNNAGSGSLSDEDTATWLVHDGDGDGTARLTSSASYGAAMAGSSSGEGGGGGFAGHSSSPSTTPTSSSVVLHAAAGGAAAPLGGPTGSSSSSDDAPPSPRPLPATPPSPLSGEAATGAATAVARHTRHHHRHASGGGGNTGGASSGRPWHTDPSTGRIIRAPALVEAAAVATAVALGRASPPSGVGAFPAAHRRHGSSSGSTHRAGGNGSMRTANPFVADVNAAALGALLAEPAARREHLGALYGRVPAASPLKALLAYAMGVAELQAPAPDAAGAEGLLLEAALLLDTQGGSPSPECPFPPIASDLGIAVLLRYGDLCACQGKGAVAVAAWEAALAACQFMRRPADARALASPLAKVHFSSRLTALSSPKWPGHFPRSFHVVHM